VTGRLAAPKRPHPRAPATLARPAVASPAAAAPRPQQPARRRAPLTPPAVAGTGGAALPAEPGPPAWEARVAAVLEVGTKLFPLWVVLAALAGFYCPPLFSWFTDAYVTNSLMAVMLVSRRCTSGGAGGGVARGRAQPARVGMQIVSRR
jgi:hypothetical protein